LGIQPSDRLSRLTERDTNFYFVLSGLKDTLYRDKFLKNTGNDHILRGFLLIFGTKSLEKSVLVDQNGISGDLSQEINLTLRVSEGYFLTRLTLRVKCLLHFCSVTRVGIQIVGVN